MTVPPPTPATTSIKFPDVTAVVGCISGGDETAYRDEVQRHAAWCSESNPNGPELHKKERNHKRLPQRPSRPRSTLTGTTWEVSLSSVYWTNSLLRTNQSTWSQTQKNSFYPTAIRELNQAKQLGPETFIMFTDVYIHCKAPSVHVINHTTYKHMNVFAKLSAVLFIYTFLLPHLCTFFIAFFLPFYAP